MMRHDLDDIRSKKEKEEDKAPYGFDPKEFPVSKESLALMEKDVPIFPEWFKHIIEDDNLPDMGFTQLKNDEYFIGSSELVLLLNGYCAENHYKTSFNRKTIGPKMKEIDSVTQHVYKGKTRGFKFNSKNVLKYINEEYYGKINKCLIDMED